MKRSTMVTRRAGYGTAQLAVVVAVLVAWQLAADHNVIDTFTYSKPSAIWDYLRQWSDSSETTGTTLWQDLWTTCVVFIGGYLIGVAGGVGIGLLTGLVRPLREVLGPFITFANAVPKLLLLPLLVVLFGFGYVPQIVLVISVIVLFVAISVAEGVAEIPEHVRDHARVLGASRVDVVRHIYLPSLSMWVVATSRLTVGYAIQAAIAAEFIGASRGLGFRFVDAQANFRSDEMFASFAVVMILAVVIDVALALVERRVTRWMPSVSALA